jgi:hypothetical protein
MLNTMANEIPVGAPCACCAPWQGIDITAEEAALLHSNLPEAGDAFAVIAHWAQIAADECGELVYVVSPGNKTEYIGVPGQGRYLPRLPRKAA